MQIRKVRFALVSGILAATVASGGDVMIPEVTEMPGAQKLLVTLAAGEGPALLVRSIGGEEQRATLRLPSEGLDRYKLALIAQTTKEGTIAGFSLVTWKPGEKKEGGTARAWPELKDVAGATARIRGAQALMLRRLAAPEKDAKWSFELISFRRIEPKEEDDPIVRAKKEVIEEGGARLIEDRRFTLIAPTTPTEDPRYGVLLVPAWKEEGRTLDGFDGQLVTTPAPARASE
jgi:hypothetical protein